MISTSSHYIIRVGLLGHIGRFRAPDGLRYDRGRRVLCRTVRGLEVGEVLSCVTDHVMEPSVKADGRSDGTLVRALTAEDELLQARLVKHREQAVAACQVLLQLHAVPATLIDAEQLFDASCLYFYFLGEIPGDIQPLIEQLAATYESRVKFRDFVSAVEHGCGPGCGTDEAAGCGTACGSCAASSVCHTR